MNRSLLLGAFGGLLFVANASISGSNAWPLLWPTLAGAAAGLTAAHGRRAGLSAGLGSFVVVAVLGTIVTLLIVPDSYSATMQRYGIGDGGALTILLIMLVLGVLSGVLAWLASGVAGLVRR
ncbi:hypothetical protein [Sphingosinithalassobacter sp. CS137]|uniref:hypothetical protein n=1 Tax=Sphingosinithalassobacter sp. CS137 TaxID=2762748 RepID=UPI00165DFF96|nr:hypothetical protein [Sphingosinithalassobacter sp. CS137]